MKAVLLDLKTLDDLDLSELHAEFAELEVYMETSPAQTRDRIQGADVVLTNKVVLDAELIASVPSLKLICVLATGTNNIDLEAAKAQGVQVSNCVAYGVNSVVQHVWSMILALHTQLPRYDLDAKSGAWAASSQFCLLPYPVREVSGRTLGILGYGNLGQGVAAIATAFGMDVLVGELPGATVREGRVSFQQLLAESDVLSLHCPLTVQTQGLIDAGAFAAMKSDAMLINCARGGIVDEQALADALREGRLAGAATDVLTAEPPKEGNPLLDSTLPNMIVTPHSAWGSLEARTRIVAQTVENVAAFKAGDAIRVVG